MAIRWGIIGCGDVCEVKSGPALYKVPGSELSIVMRRDAARAADFARRHGARRHTTDADEVIGSPDVDIVYIATPPGDHEAYALRVAAVGKPCYVEKPMARSAAECRRMLEAFEAARKPLFVAYYRRAMPRFLALREQLASGVLGELLAVSHTYQGRANPSAAPSSNPAGWRESVPSSGGGLFVDLGSHVVDLLDFLLGPLDEVSGHAARRSEPKGERRGRAEDTVVASFRTASGALGTLRYQFHTHGAVDRLEFVGTRGSLALSVFGQEPLELIRGEQRELVGAEHPAHVHQPLVQTIVDELTGKGRCPSTGHSGLRASAVIDRILDSYYGGRSDAFWMRPDTWPGPER
ncbi:MAG TPA: Gfo/Idh/MocA family oxidoreductase [Polyangiaceae bacterium]|nr:Gfo/Idh/MocA family oxidoreductase [Polyangiaceae bacterium]